MTESATAACKRGHALTSQNIYHHSQRGPMCKRCRADAQRRFTAKRKERGKYKALSRDQATRIVSALREGHTLKNITAGVRGRQGYIPGLMICSPQELRQFRIQNPTFDKLVTPLVEGNRFKALRMTFKRFAAPSVMRANGAHAFEAVTAATRGLPDAIRADVQSEMFVALAEGQMNITEVHLRVREFVRNQNRADRQSVFNPWGHLSLDKPLSDDGSLKLLDIVREDQRLWT